MIWILKYWHLYTFSRFLCFLAQESCQEDLLDEGAIGLEGSDEKVADPTGEEEPSMSGTSLDFLTWTMLSNNYLKPMTKTGIIFHR